jgi:hypothetical protein
MFYPIPRAFCERILRRRRTFPFQVPCELLLTLFYLLKFVMAGVPGLEPGPKVLETSMLTIDTIPLRLFWILDLRFWIEVGNIFRFNPKSKIQNPKSYLLVFFMHRMAAATTAKLFEFQPVRRVFLIFCRHVIALFALCALQNYIISRHNFQPL